MLLFDQAVFQAYWKLNSIFARRHNLLFFFWLLPLVTLLMWFISDLNEEYKIILSSFFGDYLIANIHVIITNFAVVFAGYYLIKLDLDGRERGAIVLSRIKPLEPIINLVAYLSYIAIPQAIVFFAGLAFFFWFSKGVTLTQPDQLNDLIVKLLFTILIVLFNTIPISCFIACGFYGSLEAFALIGLLSSFMLSLPSTFILDKWGFPRLLVYFALQLLVAILWLLLAYFLGSRYYRAHKYLKKGG